MAVRTFPSDWLKGTGVAIVGKIFAFVLPVTSTALDQRYCEIGTDVPEFKSPTLFPQFAMGAIEKSFQEILPLLAAPPDEEEIK